MFKSLIEGGEVPQASSKNPHISHPSVQLPGINPWLVGLQIERVGCILFPFCRMLVLSWRYRFVYSFLKENLLKWVQYSFDSPVAGKNLFKFMCVWIKPCSGFIWFLPHVETLFWYRPKAISSKWRQNGGFKRLTFHELLIVRFPSVIENSVFNALD